MMDDCRKYVSAALVLIASAFVAAGAGAAKLAQWTTIESQHYGFTIAYPASVFTRRLDVQSEEGHVLISRDGGARLVVGAFDNDNAATLLEYREQLLTENYRGADLDYAPMKRRFFIVSGTRGDMHFYERVSFTCGGRLINSWALLYPLAERHIYDPIVEAVARTYQPGAGRTGHCD